MKKNQIRIFTYLPNPRIWKALVVADIQGVNIELRSDSPKNLKNWLWDFNAIPLSEKDKKLFDNSNIKAQKGFKGNLIKTEKFLKLNPYGTVPVAFNMSGSIGIFESNSILRVIARLGKKRKIYGKNAFDKSLIDSYLDACLVFATLTQNYTLALYSNKKISKQLIDMAENAYSIFLNGIEKNLKENRKKYLVSNNLTIADICFFAELSQFLFYETKAMRYLRKEKESIFYKNKKKYKLSYSFFCKLLAHKSFKKFAYRDLYETGVLRTINFKNI
ncbi:MAG: hypothetical protein CBC22_00270 [Alphaproteobacteria bacterium TMED62]|nr:MAG: hypothetical protein CBC22_00270 [Alphaproteobacteria bacterium TMED62]|tara:strand:+ start:2869 stop:3693 length:825 start_codon:yes stop_codon:yes gene_type:complete